MKKTIKIPKGYKVVGTSLTPLQYQIKKGYLGKKITKKISLPKNTKPTNIYYKPIKNEIHVEYKK